MDSVSRTEQSITFKERVWGDRTGSTSSHQNETDDNVPSSCCQGKTSGTEVDDRTPSAFPYSATNSSYRCRHSWSYSRSLTVTRAPCLYTKCNHSGLVTSHSHPVSLHAKSKSSGPASAAALYSSTSLLLYLFPSFSFYLCWILIASTWHYCPYCAVLYSPMSVLLIVRVVWMFTLLGRPWSRILLCDALDFITAFVKF